MTEVVDEHWAKGHGLWVVNQTGDGGVLMGEPGSACWGIVEGWD